jgi:hypothetical protein
LGILALIGTLDDKTQLQARYAEKKRLDAKKQRTKKKPTKPASEPGG